MGMELQTELDTRHFRRAMTPERPLLAAVEFVGRKKVVGLRARLVVRADSDEQILPLVAVIARTGVRLRIAEYPYGPVR